MLKLTFAVVLVAFGSALAAVDNDVYIIDESCPAGQSRQCGSECNTKCSDYLNPLSQSEQLIRCFAVPCNALSECRCDYTQGYRYSETKKACIPEHECNRFP